MLEMNKKVETYLPVGDGRDPKQHGYEGPVQVGDGAYRSKSEHVFMETVKKMGYQEIVDLQDGTACGGFSVSIHFLFQDIISLHCLLDPERN